MTPTTTTSNPSTRSSTGFIAPAFLAFLAVATLAAMALTAIATDGPTADINRVNASSGFLTNQQAG